MLRRAPAVEFTKHQIALQRTCVSGLARNRGQGFQQLDRKSTRLNSSHSQISYAVFCLKKKTKISYRQRPNTNTTASICSDCLPIAPLHPTFAIPSRLRGRTVAFPLPPALRSPALPPT